MRNEYPLVNTGFSKKMWLMTLEQHMAHITFIVSKTFLKVNFVVDTSPMVRTEAISKVREHYKDAENYGIVLDRKSLPVEIDYKAIEIFFNSN